MSKQNSKSHKAMDDKEWFSRLRSFASTGVWPSDAGNRPAPRQQKWYTLCQKIEKCPLLLRGQRAFSPSHAGVCVGFIFLRCLQPHLDPQAVQPNQLAVKVVP
ncbi:hypothetical protein CHARACLAT_031696 [Characodon lateralis]|uniref:Uncharacterized protein n=1 Tax=Characodon lateralis TaxID=208331 RepID=A0ABU7DBR5_9TELE|nr:hypothetical protein [Characodon lateralis]